MEVIEDLIDPQEEAKRAIEFVLSQITGDGFRRPTCTAVMQISFDDLVKLVAKARKLGAQDAMRTIEERQVKTKADPKSRFDKMEFKDEKEEQT